MTPENGVAYRLDMAERDIEQNRADVTVALKMTSKHELELHGERGIYKALEDLTAQLRWTQRALWGLAASVIVAALTLALTGGSP